MSDAEATALLRPAVRAGDAETVERLCALFDTDPFAPWPEGGDAVTWAAGHGDLRTLRTVLDQHEVWVDYYDRHRDREREVASLRAALAAATRPAVVTELEERLDIETPPDVLLDRATGHGDPTSADWRASVEVLTRREPYGPVCRWALARVADPDPRVRRFTADVLQEFAYDARPLRAEVVAALRPRLSTEDDAGVLLSVLTAFAEYHHPDTRARAELHHLADHPAADVRAEVAERIEDLDLLLRLASDPAGPVRGGALAQLFRTDPGTPQAHAAYRAHRDDDADARMNALAGLARFGDDAAQARLLAMAGGREDVPAYWRYEEVVMHRRLASPRRD